MGKMNVGLALGSGGARGLAHVGVIKALEENDIQIDMVAGTSMGAVVGLLYAAGFSVQRMKAFAEDFGSRRLSYWIDPTFFKGGGLLKGDRIEDSLEDLVGPVKFSDLKKPFCVVASDLLTGKRVVISEGYVVPAVRASFAIPGIFSPVMHNGRWLVDGALVEPVPAKILREKGATHIISVSVCNELEKIESLEKGGSPKIFEVLLQSLAVIERRLSEPALQLSDHVISPDLGNFAWTDFDHFDELIGAGYTAALKEIPSISKGLKRDKRKSILHRLFSS